LIFKDLKLVSKKETFVINYKSSTFISVRKKTLAHFFKDVATKSFFNKFLEMKKEQVVPSEVDMEAHQLLNYYNAQKKIFYKGMRVTGVSENKAEFQYFIKAVDYIKNFGLTHKQFLDSQIEGFAFVNNGKGKFPDPKQLANDKTEDRILEYVQKHNVSKKSSRPKMFLSDKEKQTDLRDNPKFWGIWLRFKAEDDITIEEACYLDLCIRNNRGEPHKGVNKLIEKLL